MAKISEENDKKKVSCNTKDNELKHINFEEIATSLKVISKTFFYFISKKFMKEYLKLSLGEDPVHFALLVRTNYFKY